ncbi:CPLD64 [Auxenochlorella protothecoides x Auxenochlorella symbiontica]
MSFPTVTGSRSACIVPCGMGSMGGKILCSRRHRSVYCHGAFRHSSKSPVLRAVKDKTDTEEPVDPAATTEKYGLEAGLWKALTSRERRPDAPSRADEAKALLKQYGSAYLLTSISFALVSFGACYLAVSAGVDVGALLTRVGLAPGATSERVGTVAIAYAAHKALSPVRFPPTVALTPVVARWLGKRGKEGSSP